MKGRRRHVFLPALAAAVCLAGFQAGAVADEPSSRIIEHRSVTGYRTGNHARACPPGQYRAHGACYAYEDSRDDRYNADYRHSYRSYPYRRYPYLFDHLYLYGPYRHGHYRHGPYRHGYRFGIHLDWLNGYRY